ncbi:MAG: hypothetical protein IPK92_22565 [Nitrospira sp.]|jgi:hypothetical protein|nr:hypothetical protein [Nitrospira sp.]
MIHSTPDMQERVVLFVDLLGFASLTESHSIELDRIHGLGRPLENIAMILSGQKDNRLTQTFTSFHRVLKGAIDLAQIRHPLTAITFSDSAYIVTNRLYEAVNFASHFVRTLVSQCIPVRAGIAYGTFAAVRFRSDVTLEGGDHAAHFLGTGVVRAHAAETCGIKGIRILLHPSAAALLTNHQHNAPSPQKKHVYFTKLLGEPYDFTVDNPEPEEKCVHYVECSAAERDNPLHVQYEIDYWRFRRTQESKAWRSVQDMWDSAPQGELIHYEATAHAINRMRMAKGEASLGKLRRRTLPRTTE